MSANLDKLKAIMREMFQLDQAELDFGIYRIMNQKRDEIEKFLDKDLLPQVEAAFSDFGLTAKEALVDELDKMKAEIERLGYVAEDNPRYQEKKAALAKAVDVTALENEVFSHLANFFRRYYQGGDFLSLRRYKAGVYAIPYEGEEVKLHWANADQYYIKSSENFRDYIFKLQSGKKVHFKLIEASTEQNNKKEETGKERRFILVEDTPLLVDNCELYIRFEYRVADEKSKQAALNESAVQTILATTEADWTRELSALAPTEKNPRRTLIEKHLNDYTSKYSFDYFIHKDLGGFMRRELDFFIKNEVLFIDDLDADHVKSSIAKVKVVKGIGHKIIAFLEQLENFQKKLWLKKKFVVETGYCITIDRVPLELYPTIIANTAQVEEWKRLYAIQDIEGDLHTPKYSDPLTVEFLNANPLLVIDTAFFNREFTEKLLASFDSMDEATDGLLVHSENFQAMNLLMERFRGQVQCTYIDPPYNTGSDGFIYKDNYQHASWLSMMFDRLALNYNFLDACGAFWGSIDDKELIAFKWLLEQTFGAEHFISDIAVVNNFKGRQDRKHIATAHEHLMLAEMMDFNSYGFPLTEQQVADYRHSDSQGLPYQLRDVRKRGGNDTRVARPKLYFPIYWDDINKNASLSRRSDRDVEIFPVKSDGVDGCWRWGAETVEKNLSIIEASQVRDTGKWNASYRVYLENDGQERTSKPKSIWFGSQYSSDRGIKELRKVIPTQDFTSPKSPEMIKDILLHSTCDDDLIFDYFSGSGTTAIATMLANATDEGNRKYILVEMGDHFDSVLKPRIQKVIYSKDWKDGKPLSRKGSSHLFKYIRLESYEDALNNLQLKSTDAQQSLLAHHDKLREEYMLSYMLDVESRGSASLLNVDEFKDPFGYQMKIARGNETKVTTIDLMETFNYLLGIKVLRISAPERRTAEFERDGEGRLQLKGKPRSCAIGEGWTFREVEGKTLDEEKVLIIWRSLTGNAEEDNLMLEAYFSKRNYNTLDFEFSRIYVNGDNNLENLKIGEERWKVALIEQEFKRLMFDVEGM